MLYLVAIQRLLNIPDPVSQQQVHSGSGVVELDRKVEDLSLGQQGQLAHSHTFPEHALATVKLS